MMLRQIFVRLGGAMLAAGAVLLPMACSSPTGDPSTRYATPNVGYDVTKDSAISGQYLSSGAYVDGQGVNAEEVRWRTRLHGVEAARKDGYDLVVWSGPAATPAASTETKVYLSKGTGSYQTYGHYLSFACIVRGYRSNGDHPPNARPVSAAIDQINGELARCKLL